MEFTDAYWKSGDGLTLHYRHYPGGESGTGRLPVLCLHGLTRNARDFHELAVHLSGSGHDVYVPEMRGRGESDPAREMHHYDLPTYVEDVELLLAELNIGRFISIGTSMGGLMTMILAVTDASRLAGAVINDVGPKLHLPGLERIAGNAIRTPSFPTWVHAARELSSLHGEIHPNWKLADWIAHAKRVMRLSPSGKIVPAYDSRIGQAFANPADMAAVDAWESWMALKDVPTLLLRGELSDLLSDEVAEQAVAALAKARLVCVPGVGHAPMLDEPEALAAIDRLIEEAEAEARS